jgi:hypothetical protein
VLTTQRQQTCGAQQYEVVLVGAANLFSTWVAYEVVPAQGGVRCWLQ